MENQTTQQTAARLRQSLYRSTALATLLYAGLGLGSARAQSVTATGDLDPSPPVSPNWTVFDELVVGKTATGTLTIAGGGTVSIPTNPGYGVIGDSSTGNGTVTVTGPGSAWTIGGANPNDDYNQLYVGWEGRGQLTIENGGRVSVPVGFIGTKAGSVGTVTVSGAGSTWANSDQLQIGISGTGTMNVEDGGAVSNTIGFIGGYASSVGTVTVTGTGSTWANSDQVQVGVRGTGTMNVEDGGAVSNTAGYIGGYATGVGIVTVSGAGSTWSNTNDLYVGDEGTGTLTIKEGGKVGASLVGIGGVGGDGALYLNGNATSRGVLETGYVVKGPGTAILGLNGGILRATADESDFLRDFGALTVGTEGAWFDSNGHDITVGTSTTFAGSSSLNKIGLGTLTLTGDSSGFAGATTVEGGALAIASGGKLGGSDGTIGSAVGSDGTVRVSGAGSTWANTNDLVVGEHGKGTLNIEDGGKASSGGNVMIGLYLDGGTGVVTVSGAGSTLTSSGNLYAGYYGAGTLVIENGGKVSNGNGQLGGPIIGTGIGNAIVTGAGSVWTNSGNLSVGYGATGTLTVANGAVVHAATVDIAQYSARSGTINIGAAAGDPAVAAGTLDTATVVFGSSGGTSSLNFNHTGATTFTAAMSGSIGSGTQALNHYAGTTTLTGDSSGFAGTTTVSGGTLLVGDPSGSGKLGGTVNVGANGTLGGTGDLGSASTAVTIDAGGVHTPGRSQSVLGDYVNHGTLQIAAGPAAANKVVVAGAVDITGATLDLVLSPANAAGWNALSGPFTIIDKQSAGVVTGTFNPVTQNLLFLDTQLDYAGGDGNDVTLQLIRNDLSFGSVGKTRNQRATGDAIATLGSSNILWRTIALNGDPDSVRASFDALSGEIHASAKSALIEDSRFVRNAINDRIRAAFAAPGASHAPALAYASIDTPAAVSPDHAGPVFWSYGFGSWGSTDSDGNAAALKRSTGGLLVGTDGFVGDWRIGVMTGYSHSRFNASDRFSSGNSDNYHFGAYGGTQWGSLSFRSGLAYTWHELDTRRVVAIPGFSDNLSTRYNAGTTQVFGEFGYGMAAAGARFEPFANLAYVNLHTGDFAERGGMAALTGRSDTTGVTFTTAGLRAQTDLPLWNTLTTLRGMLGWRHAFGDTIPAVTQAFAGSSAFTVAGVPIARDSAVLEAGLDFNISPNATFGFAYEGQFASGADDQGFKANVAVKF
jgi:outer membrane autotransporter protein